MLLFLCQKLIVALVFNIITDFSQKAGANPTTAAVIQHVQRQPMVW
jgi:hypothetical protein